MTLRLAIGVDPGIAGGIAFIADGEFAAVYDLPTLTKTNGKHKIDAAALAGILRDECSRHAGAFMCVALEDVQPMPARGTGIGMGATSAFSFGRSVGAIEGVVLALGIPLVPVHASRWKNALGLRGADKDATRTLMIQRFPKAAPQLTRKKDIGRADALAMAYWKHRDDVMFDGVPNNEATTGAPA